MSNFNHERMMICVMTNRFARTCMEESLKFANKRKTFGKKLIEHPVIRWKIAEVRVFVFEDFLIFDCSYELIIL